MNTMRLLPPVPKFDLNNCQALDETELYEQKQKNCNIKIDKGKFNLSIDKRRMIGIIEELDKQIDNLSELLGDKQELIQQQSIKLVQQSLLDKTKSKKYNSIAIAITIHAIRQLYIPITIKKIQAYLGESDKQVKRILSLLQNEYPVKPQSQIISFIEQFCDRLGQSENFKTFCKSLLFMLDQKNLISGEHENIVAASIIKAVSDLAYYNHYGIQLTQLAQIAQCCDFSIKNFLKKIDSLSIPKDLMKQFYQNYQINQ